MFHTYITNSCGNKVDIDRASFLMDKRLFHQLMEELYVPAEDRVFEQWPEYGMDQDCALKYAICLLPQMFWNRYCERHYEKYKEPFLPDIKPNWDR